MSLPSTHMLAVLRICMALEWASMRGLESRLNDSGVGSAWLLAAKKRGLLVSHAYAWSSTHMRGKDEAKVPRLLGVDENTSAREAYTCWAHQQANPNLSEIPITQIPDLMQTNAEKERPMFFGCLKSDYGASSSSKADQQESVPLRTAPPLSVYQLPHPPPN
ncbi:hypothetical protein PIB30_097791 [Stylosanthes scabra]|uniref:Uncharacterized protein n=1 Tax=Stylosanthes scabra TaxID=79078 RepID=A0ABU6QWD9_9FABA|nr:hypothetical protein [Stylosanthes scabra]